MNSQTTDRLKERAWPILLRLIIIAVALLVTTLISTVKANAQIVVANPLEWAVLVEGNELIDGQIKNETEGMTRTAVLQSTIAAEFSGIKSWEKKYNAYLKSADGFASSIKAATYLYNGTTTGCGSSSTCPTSGRPSPPTRRDWRPRSA